LSKEIKEKYAEFRNILASQEKYTFGGFAPPNPAFAANGTFLENTNGTWAGLAWGTGGGGSSGTLVIGDGTSDGSWRFIISGNDLSVQTLVGGIWIEESSFTRS
jgi:hypothetical protein